ncbi:MAG: hypothetical protein JWO67_1954 [Streptosporangiaceae bacterium]|nr:hypothetical protein [Streptosporangiaceae bacterium]
MTQATRSRGAGTPYRRVPFPTKVTQGLAVLEQVTAGASIRQAAAATGLSPTTAWRRLWWLRDWALSDFYGCRNRTLPPQRGTAACPRGRPWIEVLDGPGGPLDRTHHH